MVDSDAATEVRGAPMSTPSGRAIVSGLWHRELHRYPRDLPRAAYLGIVVLVSITLYYELYVQGSVSTQIIAHYHLSLAYFTSVMVIGNGVGALGSILAGLADRWGRANLVVGGLLIASLLILFVLPNAPDGASYTAEFAVLGLVEGAVLVATPALMRDFSPQLGRAAAMGFWTMGPVMGSLVTTEVSSHTLNAHPSWRFQFTVCGLTGLVVFVIALFGLRELSPRLRDQLMVSSHDRALIEARAVGDTSRPVRRRAWRQMVRRDIVGPAFAISVFLVFYYIAVSSFVVYCSVNFGYSEAKANSLANWYWGANAIAVVVTGVVSDRLRVRKPFMVAGAVVSAAGLAVFAGLTTHPTTSYHTFAWLLALIGSAGGVAYCAWMAGFTETVEKHNPAMTATGLAIWGGMLRAVVCLSLTGLMLMVSSAGTLVDHGPRVAALAAKYAPQTATLSSLSTATQNSLAAHPDDPAAQVQALSELTGLSVGEVTRVVTLSTQDAEELKTVQAVDPQVLSALIADKQDQEALAAAIQQVEAAFGIDEAAARQRLIAANKISTVDYLALRLNGPKIQHAGVRLAELAKMSAPDAAYLRAHGAQVLKAQKDSPQQWQRWWWLTFAAQLLFLPFVFLLTGRWSPRRAREDVRAHEEAIEKELQDLIESSGAVSGVTRAGEDVLGIREHDAKRTQGAVDS